MNEMPQRLYDLNVHYGQQVSSFKDALKSLLKPGMHN